MQKSLDNVRFLYQGKYMVEEMRELPMLTPYSEEVCEYLNKLSDAIFKDKEAKTYSDIVSFAFFCRKANLYKLKQSFNNEQNRLGRGLTFHIAPSNVPINFAYTLVAGLLAGNACVVRASSKDFPQTNIICRIMKSLLENHNLVNDYIMIVSYGRDKEITDYFSSICDVRVIWGGDNTIREIRKSEIPARSFDITFADRYSVCVLNAKDIIEMSDLEKRAQDFYNDTYLYDQNACSSPRLMYWIGNKEEIKKAKKIFWDAIYDFVRPKYNLESVLSVDKLVAGYKCSIELDGVKLPKSKDNLIQCIELESLCKDLPKFSCAGGSFLEYGADTLDDLAEIVTKKYQTLSFLGGNEEELVNWVMRKGLLGIDRVVPMGKTVDFTMIWDGYDLVETLSRICFSYR